MAVAQEHVVPQGRLFYAITVANRGDADLDDVTVQLRLPAGMAFSESRDSAPNAACGQYYTCEAEEEATWSFDTLPAGVARTIEVNAGLNNTFMTGDSIDAMFRFQAAGTDADTVTRSTSVFEAPDAALLVHAPMERIVPDTAFTYELVLGQVGSDPVSDAVLQLALPAGVKVLGISDSGTREDDSHLVHWDIADLPIGSSLRRTVEVQLPASTQLGELLAAQASLVADDGTTKLALSEYVVSAVEEPSVPHVDVSCGSNPVAPGARAFCVASVANDSTREVTDVTLALRAPAGMSFNESRDAAPNADCGQYYTCEALEEVLWPLGQLDEGATESIEFNFLAQDGVLDDGNLVPLRFTALVGDDRYRINRAMTVRSEPDARLALSTPRNPLVPGETVTVRIDVGHVGAAALSGANLTASVPALATLGNASDGGAIDGTEASWDLGSLEVAENLVRTMDVTLSDGLAAGTLVPVEVQLRYDGGLEDDLTVERALLVVDSAAPIDVSISADAESAVAGEGLIYTIEIENVSAREVNGVGVVVRVPRGIGFSESDDAEPNAACGEYYTCEAEEEASWQLGDLAAGGSQTITVNASVAASMIAGDLISLPVRLSWDGVGTRVLVQKTVPVQ